MRFVFVVRNSGLFKMKYDEIVLSGELVVKTIVVPGSSGLFESERRKAALNHF